MKTTIKFFALAFVLFATACSNDDEYDMLNSLWRNVTQNEARIDALEKWCAQANTNITSLQTIVNVFESNDAITSITPVMEGGVEIGYTITFSNHDPITIYHGKDGKDGQNGAYGQNGTSPIVGVAQSGGVYYWTLNGEWLLDADGNKLPVSGKDGANGENGQNGSNGQNGVTPQLKIENDYWWISYDNGNTWTQLGKAKGEDGENGQNGAKGDKGDTGDKGDKGDKGDAGDSMFQSVTQDADNVYFTLTNGTVITIAKGGSGADQPNSDFIFEVTLDANGGVGTMPKDTFYYGQAKELDYAAFGKDGFAFVGWNTRADGSGVSYKNGEELTLDKNMTLYAQWESFDGLLPGKFSVQEGKFVQFAPGNLQYQASTNTWRFAEKQYDCVGSKNAKISETNTDWIDLFGYGTSGTSPYFPYLTNSYLVGNNWAMGSVSTRYYPKDSLTVENGLDWGINTIENTTRSGWRTLQGCEDGNFYANTTFIGWHYVTFKRENAKDKKALAVVNGVNGLLLLPDYWLQPKGISYTPTAEHFYQNEYTEEEWIVLASQGAVFLPAAGYRRGVDIMDTGAKVVYWSSSKSTNYEKWGAALIVYEGGEVNNSILKGCCGFLQSVAVPLKSDGCAVRLVLDVQE